MFVLAVINSIENRDILANNRRIVVAVFNCIQNRGPLLNNCGVRHNSCRPFRTLILRYLPIA